MPAVIPILVSPQVPPQLAEANAPVRTAIEGLLVVQRQDCQRVLDILDKLVGLVVLSALLHSMLVLSRLLDSKPVAVAAERYREAYLSGLADMPDAAHVDTVPRRPPEKRGR
jgi:hypothetical protein